MDVDEPVKKVFCGDCGCECQLLPSGWRCPWVLTSSRRTAWVGGDLVLMCDRPYEKSKEVALVLRERGQ